jgi:proteasomal ATPase-associated factor 1
MDAYFCRFFPSGEVILSGGSDMQLKIWSAITGECAVTLIGHKAAILDTAIVEKGKNIISVSRDGTAKLWNLGHKKCFENVIQLGFDNAINTCALQTVTRDLDLGIRETPISELAVGTLNKILLIGCESGNVFGIGLNSNKKVLFRD